MKFCEYQPGKFVNPEFIVRVSIECDERARIANPFDTEELRRRMAVVLEIEGDHTPARVGDGFLDQVSALVPGVKQRMRALEQAILKAHIIATLCRFPLAA